VGFEIKPFVSLGLGLTMDDNAQRKFNHNDTRTTVTDLNIKWFLVVTESGSLYLFCYSRNYSIQHHNNRRNPARTMRMCISPPPSVTDFNITNITYVPESQYGRHVVRRQSFNHQLQMVTVRTCMIMMIR